MNIWESVFTQSRVNDGYYEEDRLPDVRWEWPKGTWFQSRLDYARDHSPLNSLKTGKKLRETDVTWVGCTPTEAMKTAEVAVVTSGAVSQRRTKRPVKAAANYSRGDGKQSNKGRQKSRAKSASRKKTQQPMCAS